MKKPSITRVLNNHQRGYTLVEVLVALAITGIIVGGIAATIFQVITIEASTSNHMTAVRQVQNAGYWISHDTQMAQNIDTNDDAGTTETEVLTLTWVGWERVDLHGNQYIDSYKVRYTYDEESKELSRLQTITTRKYNKDGEYEGTTEISTSTFIAEYITSISIPAMVENKLNVTITASVVEAEEVRTYEITPRPST